MLDEEMDHMIRQAAENHHPPYNGKAWERMELLLDKHLPQKKDRKKPVFFLLLFLLLGGGLFFAATRYIGNTATVAEKGQDEKRQDQNTAQSTNTKTKDPAGNNAATITGTGTDQNTVNGINRDLASADQPGTAGSNSDQPGNDNLIPAGKADNKPATTGKTRQKTQKDPNSDLTGSRGDTKRQSRSQKGKTRINTFAPDPFEDQLAKGENLRDKNKPVTGKTAGKTDVQVIAPGLSEDTEDNSIAAVPPVATNGSNSVQTAQTKTAQEKEKAEVKKGEKEKEKTVAKTETKPTDKKKSDKKFTSNFGLTFTAGPDASFVSLKRFGKINLTYGAGLSYDFAKKFTVRTGFYVTKKIYTAAPDQYHTPGGNYPYLTGVDANCKVYEIPLSVSYSFGHKKKHNWFGNLGISSVFMKEEYYTYNYKNPAGQSYSYYKEVSNENKHYFSLLTLSAGYKYNFNKRIAVQAEPYVQVPLAGIGLGKIKLNSAGMLFTVTVKPFAKKK